MSYSDRFSDWNQGDVLREESAATLRNEGLVPEEWEAERDWVLVVSHPCDLASHDFEAEPTAELLRATPSAPPSDGNVLWGKSPRRLQLELGHTDPAVLLDISVHDRVRIPRQRLLEEAPDEDRQLTARQGELVARWLSKRYWRQAFPDNFNQRLQPIASKLQSTLKKQGGGLLAGLYLILHTHDELPPGAPYQIVLRGVMELEDHSDESARELASETLGSVVLRLGEVEDIELRGWDLVPTTEMSLDDLYYYKRWDYDDLSHRSEGARHVTDP